MMNNRSLSVRNKPPKPPNPFPAGRNAPTNACRNVFRTALRDRLVNRPFERISSYKIRDSRDNFQDTLRSVTSIAEYLRTPRQQRHPGLLLGCIPQDKSVLLKKIPASLARQMGHDLLPAISALTLEGIPQAHIKAFIASLHGRVSQLIRDCDVVQALMAWSIEIEYAALRTGTCSTRTLCRDALRLAEDAIGFCASHGIALARG